MQKFRKGATNNHLTWVMVDATDFATPESALSAATKIKIYGKRTGAAAAAFVSSGTGSLTNDIQHVGASALGIYTIALTKADLSDASAAWYDQYVISLSATGAAYQTILADGGIMDSYLSNVASYLSNLTSDLQSDFQSRVPKAVATQSLLSDVNSNLLSYLAGMSNTLSVVNAATSNTQSKIIIVEGSQFDYLSAAISDAHSDLRSLTSGVGGGTASAIAAKVWSDYESKVGSTVSDMFSALAAGGGGATASAIADKVWSDYGSKVGATPSQAYSVILATQAAVSDLHSDFQSRVPKAVATQSLLSDVQSNLLSYLAGVSDVLSQVDSGVDQLQSRITGAVATASDVASKIWAEKYTAASNVKASTFGSMVRLIGSTVSDMDSMITDMSNVLSDTNSKVAAGTSTSAIAAKVWSDFESKVGSTVSDMYSTLAAGGGGATASAIADKVWSDYGSKVGATPSKVYSVAVATQADVSDMHSDLLVMSNVLSNVDSVLSNTNSKVGKIEGSQFDAISDAISNVQSAVAVMDTILDSAASDVGEIKSVTDALTVAAATSLSKSAAGIIYGTVGATSLSTTTCSTDLAGYADDEMINRTIIFTSGTANGQAASITDYANTNGVVTFSGGIANAPVAGDTFVIV